MRGRAGDDGSDAAAMRRSYKCSIYSVCSTRHFYSLLKINDAFTEPLISGQHVGSSQTGLCVCVCVSLSLKTVFSPTEALSEEERQSRQIQTSNAPTFTQHTLGRPAGSASSPPTSAADGPVCVVSGSDVAARRSAAALPALITHTPFVFPRRSCSQNATMLQQLPS